MTQWLLATLITGTVLFLFLAWWFSYLKALSYLRLKRMERIIQLHMNKLNTVAHTSVLYKVLAGILNNFCIMAFELVAVLPIKDSTSPGMLIASIENYIVSHVSNINGMVRLWDIPKDVMQDFFMRYREILIDFQEELKNIMLEGNSRSTQLDLIELLIEDTMDSLVALVLDEQ